MNNLSIDDAYISNIKSMFKHLDDEIIWSAIYHHGFGTDGNFNEENVINYLLELSNDKSNKSTELTELTENTPEIVEHDNIVNSFMSGITNLFSSLSRDKDYEQLNQKE